MLKAVSAETLPQGQDNRRIAILPAAITADLLSEQLSPAWERTGTQDIVARAAVNQALHHLDRLFAIETQRFAFFREDPMVDVEGLGDASALAPEHAEAIIDLFSQPDISLVASMVAMTDQALEWSLSHGIQPLAWEEGIESQRHLTVMERGGKLPVAYLSPAFSLASKRLQRLLTQQAGLPRDVAAMATSEIGRSVAIELIRAGANAGERLETLASWCLTLQPFNGALLTRLIARGAYFFLHALIAAASKVGEGKIRDLCFNNDGDGLEEVCLGMGLSPGFGPFIVKALKEIQRFGQVSTASELANFAGPMADWIATASDAEGAPCEVLEEALTASDHLDWTADLPCHEAISEHPHSAEVIQLAAFRR